MDYLNYIGQDVWHFWGFTLIFVIYCITMVEIARAFNRKKE